MKSKLFTKLAATIFLFLFIPSTVVFSQQSLKREATGIDSKETFHLYLFIGQSNMAGRGKIEEQDKKNHPRVFVLNKENNWVPGIDPIHFDKEIAGVGPGLSFGKAMADRDPSIRIGLIPCAAGGSPIDIWEKGKYWDQTQTKPYDEAINRTKIGMKDGVLKGILWHQGESDSKKGLAEQYKSKLIELIKTLRKDLAMPDVPFVAGELGEYYFAKRPLAEKINEALHSISKEVKNTACVSAKGLTSMADTVHFNANSARELGRRYAEVMSDLPDKISLNEGIIVRAESRLFTDPRDAECVWSAVTVSRDNKVYIGLGRHTGTAHLYQYDPATDVMRDLGDMGVETGENNLNRITQGKIHTKIFEGLDGRIYFATHFGLWYLHAMQSDMLSYPGGHWMYYNPETDLITDMGIAVPQQGMITMTMDPERYTLYGLTWPKGQFVTYDINTRKTVNKGRISNWNAVCRTMVVDDAGNVYGSTLENRIFRYNPLTDDLRELTSVKIPSGTEARKEHARSTTAKNLWRVAVWDSVDKKIYGIHAGTSMLFEYDPYIGPEGSIKAIGQMCDSRVLRTDKEIPYATLAFTLGLDRKIYYSPVGYPYSNSAEQKPAKTSRLITYNISEGKISDMGPILVEDNKRVLELQAAATGPDNTIYFIGAVEENTPVKEFGWKLDSLPYRLRLIIYHPDK